MTHADIHTAYETVRNEIEADDFNTLDKCSEHNLASEYVALKLSSTTGTFTQFTGNDNNAYEQVNYSVSKTKDKSAYELVNNSFCITNDNCTNKIAKNSLCIKEESNAYEQISNSVGKTRDDNAYEQSNSSFCTTKDNNVYEQANNSLCTTKDNSAYGLTDDSLRIADNDNTHSTKTTQVYNHLTNSEGQYDTLQNLPDSNTSVISDWNNVYHGFDDGSYSSIYGPLNKLTNDTDKKLEDNIQNKLG